MMINRLKHLRRTTAQLTERVSFNALLPECGGIVREPVGFNKNCEAGDFILIGFEESQTVTIAFRELGYNAYSCDLKPCSGGKPEWHLQMDIRQALQLHKWKFIGLHPTCTAMTLSGNAFYAPGKPKYQERLDAVEWTIGIWNEACEIAEFVYMENPMGAMNGDKRLPKPQIIHPYYFGYEFQKMTCLWLKGLKTLLHTKEDNLFEQKTHVGKGDIFHYPNGKKQPQWIANTSTSRNNEKNRAIRSKTFPGIAKAMAEQWSLNLLKF
jgi:hypothetical protein